MPAETYDQANRRMSGMFRAGSPTPGIQPVAGTIGRKQDGPDRIYGHKPKQNIDQPFDDFSPQPSASGGAATRTFFCTSSGADVLVSPGAINSIILGQTTITAPSDGDVIYLHVTVDTDGIETALEVDSAASLPANTTTDGYTPLASVSVSGGVATPAPVAWNYSQMQKCGSTTYLWGGFGS